MTTVFIAQQQSAHDYTGTGMETPEVISHHASLQGAAKAIADDARAQAEYSEPGLMTDQDHANILRTAAEDRQVDMRDEWGDHMVSSAVRVWINRHYRIEEVELLD